ncbi:N-acetyltransferase [uncultured Pseudokineococcus sp.]|uniref:GNAT family N-acetyltransferase n=1 Tax=uncultured Pseudokineococcus sp. TaxID=1642928 RepID=UPI00262F4133|nr:GNAT family N-acetyltransferase [uncultured Pseudokineococcus sp.]
MPSPLPPPGDPARPPAAERSRSALPPSAVGGRVVVRHRLPDGAASDVVGVLERAGEVLAVRRGDGALVEVPAGDVVAARRVPPRVRRPRAGEPVVGVLDLEAVLARAWQPADVARTGRWLLRSAGDRTRRASSVLVLGEPGPTGAPSTGAGAAGDPGPAAGTADDLGRAVEAAGDWLSARGSTPRFQLPRSTGAPVGAAARADAAGLAAVADVDAELARRGWSLVSPTTVMVGALQALAAPGAAGPPAGPGSSGAGARAGAPRVLVSAAPDAAWTALVRPGAVDDPVVDGLLRSAPAQAFAVVREDVDEGEAGAAAAAGRMAVADGWAVLTDLAVATGHRRRGLARAVVAALAVWAGERGADRVALQVADGNDRARSLYESLGLVEHHRYAYREAPSPR